jgi:hypothetical protein
MTHTVTPISGLPGPRAFTRRTVPAVALVLGLWAAVLTWQTSRDTDIRPIVAGSPYMNVRSEVRRRLVQGHLRRGDIPAAQGEFETLLRFQPADREALLRWYASQLPRR